MRIETKEVHHEETRLLTVCRLAVDVDFRGGSEAETFMKAMDQVSPEFMENAIQWMKETYGSPPGLYHPGTGRDGSGDS